MSKPHKHAELIKAWADGAEIQHYNTDYNEWIDCQDNTPTWNENVKYRIKPKEKQKVKMWQWVFKYGGSDTLYTTAYFCEDKEEAQARLGYGHSGEEALFKADWTEIEVEID